MGKGLICLGGSCTAGVVGRCTNIVVGINTVVGVILLLMVARRSSHNKICCVWLIVRLFLSLPSEGEGHEC